MGFNVGRCWLLPLLLTAAHGLAADEKTRSWLYQTYDRNVPSHVGYVSLDEGAVQPVVKIVAEGLGRCFRGSFNAAVSRTDESITITLEPIMSCDEVRFVIKNDGSGGQREVKKNQEWVSDRTERGLVRIEETSSEAINAAQAKWRDQTLSKLFVKPAADVPEACAKFIGRWAAEWPGFGPSWFRVSEMDKNCSAKCAHRTNSSAPSSSQLETCSVNAGVIVRRSPQNTQYFELRGDEIRARFVPLSGGQNEAVFRRDYSPN